MIAYRDLMFTFIILFSILTVLMIPSMVFYKGHGAIKNPKGYSALSLGNMGYASAQCTSVPYELGKIPLTCPYGTISEIRSFGINPGTRTAVKDACVETEDNKICIDSLDPNFKNNIKSFCTGDKADTCSFDINNDDLVLPGKTLDATCTTNALLFVQYTCAQPTEEIAQKKQQTAIIACLGIMVSLVFSICVYYLKRDSKLDQLDWDIETITPGDYSAQYEITDKAFDWFV